MSKVNFRRLFIAAMVIVLIAGQAFASAPSNGVIAYKHIVELSETIGNRLEGTAGAVNGANYIKSTFNKMGYTATEQPFSYTTKRDGKVVQISTKNIIVVKKGLSDQQIIVGAHYDSVGVGKGADDNASAIGVMLETAQAIEAIKTPYTIRFIAFGGEEDNLKGSKYYVNHMSQSEKNKTVNMIVLDSLIAGNVKYVYGDFGSEGVLRDLALQISDELDLGLETQTGTADYPAGTTGPFSDHTYFEKAGIPYTYFEATDWRLGAKDGYTQVDLQYGVNGEIWHTQYDNLEYLEKTFPGRVMDHLNTFVTVLEEILTTTP